MTDFAIFQGKKAAYYTLGCKLNFAEMASLQDALCLRLPIYVLSILAL